ncbi:hypothetical protein HU200_011051 [Digitaria exilis]|uniref:Uncharacterized protein n=1 Tax=Digitaria exilis TaxID=1010633 RepID=A0A835KLQ1_9POAL|nr:hypothetical protein HU200_011051 [Digitaria exilis]
MVLRSAATAPGPRYRVGVGPLLSRSLLRSSHPRRPPASLVDSSLDFAACGLPRGEGPGDELRGSGGGVAQGAPGKEGQRRRGQRRARGLVFQITTAVATYRRLLNSLGTPKDTPTLRDQLQKTSQNILQLAKDAKDKLHKAAEADKSIDTSVTILQMTEVLSQVNISEQRALLAESKRQEVLQLDNEIVFNEAIIEEREQAIQEIQQQIEEIDMNIENSADATKEAKKEVTKADKTQKSNSSLLCFLVVIFGVVLLVVIIVLAA